MEAGKDRPPRYADDRYAVQRRAGFPWMRFLPDLEEEFRDSYIDLNATRMRVGALIGFLGVVGFLFVDQFLGSNLSPLRGDLVLLLVTIPAATVPVAMTFRRTSTRYVLHLVLAATMVVAMSILWVINVGRGINPWFPYESLIVVTMYIYFISGLTFYQGIVAGAFLAVAFVVSDWTLREHDKLLYEVFYLLLANGIGVIGNYLLEHQSRLMFLLNHELEQQAVLDPLTGLMNRRAFNTRLQTIWKQAQRNLTSVGLMLLDMDQFKKINDSCGHQFGDEALIHVADVLRAAGLRPLDTAARYGGDELIAAWYDVDAAWFARLAEEMPARIEGLTCDSAAGPLKVTVSGGAVLAWPRPGVDMRDAIKAADERLYEMKRTKQGHIGHVVLTRIETKK